MKQGARTSQIAAPKKTQPSKSFTKNNRASGVFENGNGVSWDEIVTTAIAVEQHFDVNDNDYEQEHEHESQVVNNNYYGDPSSLHQDEKPEKPARKTSYAPKKTGIESDLAEFNPLMTLSQGPTIDELRKDKTHYWKEPYRLEIIDSLTKTLDEPKGKAYFELNSWPQGLQAALIKTCKKIPIRFFIVDDSGSMTINDGRRVLKAGVNTKVIECTRWAELADSLRSVSEISNALGTITEFRVLNGNFNLIRLIYFNFILHLQK